MNCLTARKILLSKQSGDFSRSGGHLRAREHVNDCHECQLFFSREEQLVKIIQTKLPRTPAPSALRENILSAVAGEQQKKGLGRFDFVHRDFRPRSILSAAAAIAMILTIYFSLPWRQDNAILSLDAAVNNLIQDHLAINLKEHPLDLETSDRSQLERWLAARVDFNVAVPRIKRAKLRGGHLCLIGGKRSVSLSFQKDDTPLTLYITDRNVIDLGTLKPFATIQGKTVFHRDAKGCNLIFWMEKGLVYGLVSDLALQDLLELVS